MLFHIPPSLYKKSKRQPVCPSCAQIFHEGVLNCPLCGFSFSTAQEKFGTDILKFRRIDDRAGCLRKKQRENLAKKFSQWEKKCAPLVLALHIPQAIDHQQLRQYAVWVLNSMKMQDQEIDRPDWTLLLVLDINNRAATFAYGYKLDYYLSEELLYPALVAGYQLLMDGQFEQGIATIMKKACNAIVKEAAKETRQRISKKKEEEDKS